MAPHNFDGRGIDAVVRAYVTFLVTQFRTNQRPIVQSLKFASACTGPE